VSSIHHVEKLEHLFAQVRDALRPGGYFFLDEYIRPTKFQWTNEQLRVMNEQLDTLPESLKRSVSEPGTYKTRVIRKTIAYVNEADPSEAVRSAEIVPLLSRYFQILELNGYGGSMLHELLYDIAGNFNRENPGSLEHLHSLFQLEDELIAAGGTRCSSKSAQTGNE
jgi:SAM-dependent methyltransferase